MFSLKARIMNQNKNVTVGEPYYSVYVSLGNLFLKSNRYRFPVKIKEKLLRPRDIAYQALLNIGMEDKAWGRMLLSISNPYGNSLDIEFKLPSYVKMAKGISKTTELRKLGELTLDDMIELMGKERVDPQMAIVIAFWSTFEKKLKIKFQQKGKSLRIIIAIGTTSFSKSVDAAKFFEAMRTAPT